MVFGKCFDGFKSFEISWIFEYFWIDFCSLYVCLYIRIPLYACYTYFMNAVAQEKIHGILWNYFLRLLTKFDAVYVFVSIAQLMALLCHIFHNMHYKYCYWHLWRGISLICKMFIIKKLCWFLFGFYYSIEDASMLCFLRWIYYDYSCVIVSIN